MSVETFVEWFIVRSPDWKPEEVIRQATIEFPLADLDFEGDWEGQVRR